MSEFETISWVDVPGNKYSKSLNVSMLSETGYVAMQKVKQAYGRGKMCYVIYNRDYIIVYLIKRVLLALSVVGKEKIDSLIDEAWEQLISESELGDNSQEAIAS